MKQSCLWLLLGCALPAAAAQGQSGPIVADQGGRSLGTTVGHSGTTYSIDGGRVAGSNLFHSFARFDLPRSQAAVWTHSAGDPARITNVINRVTGGSPSSIEGRIDSTGLPNASFYFINPAGIVIGEGAQIDVPASAYFSTASELRFASGGVFLVAAPDGSTLAADAPESFGFLGGEGSLAFIADDALARPVPLSLSGSSVELRASLSTGGLIIAASGPAAAEIGIDGSASAPLRGEVVLGARSTDPFDDPTVYGFDLSARSDAVGSGQIVIRGGTITASDVWLSTFASNEAPAGEAGASGGEGNIVLEGSRLTLSDSAITTDPIGAGRAGSIVVDAGQLELGGSKIASVPGFGTSGHAGSVSVRGESLVMRNASLISSSTAGQGDAGEVRIDTAAIEISESSQIFSQASFGATGDAGSVSIVSDTLQLSGRGSIIDASTFGAGRGGTVDIQTDLLALSSGAQVQSTTDPSSEADSGTIRISADEVRLESGSQILTSSFGTGSSGNIAIDAREITVANAQITSSALGEGIGRGGGIEIRTDRLLVDGGQITTSAEVFKPGNADPITIDAGTLEVRNGGLIQSTAFGFGDAGLILIRADTISLSEGGRLQTNSARGRAGDIQLIMPENGLLLLSGERSPGVIETSSGPGQGGRIIISNPAAIVSDGGLILALGESGGANVQIDTPFFVVSTESVNIVAVDGVLAFSNGIYDVSAGTADVDLTALDASGVLRGQCRAVRATGEVSQLSLRSIGPFGSSASAGPPPAVAESGVGGCR